MVRASAHKGNVWCDYNNGQSGCWQLRVDLFPINRTLSRGTTHIRSPGGACSLSSGGLKLTRLAGDSHCGGI